jgi:hypothetical protein
VMPPSRATAEKVSRSLSSMRTSVSFYRCLSSLVFIFGE